MKYEKARKFIEKIDEYEGPAWSDSNEDLSKFMQEFSDKEWKEKADKFERKISIIIANSIDPNDQFCKGLEHSIKILKEKDL